MTQSNCARCDYDLRGLTTSTRCPECGFDLADPSVRARLKASGGESLMTIVAGLLAQLIGIGLGLWLFTRVIGTVIRTYGGIGSAILMAAFFAWLAIVFMVLPRWVRRVMHPDGLWDDVMTFSSEGLVIQSRKDAELRQAIPWTALDGIKLKRSRRGESHLKIIFPHMQILPMKFGLTYTIDADEKIAHQLCEMANRFIIANRDEDSMKMP